MATKLFLRSTQANGIGATYFDMLPTAGAGAATAIVDTVGSGTEIQWTQTAGGSVIQFVSGRVPSGGFTLTTTDISIWAKESNNAANSGGRFRVFKRAANGTETELGGGPFNDGVEFTTSDAEYLWVGNVTDTAFAENDRILLKLYITNQGTMGSGRTCTLTYNGADAATGDSFFNIAETVAFKSESVSHAATGALTGQIGSVAGSSFRKSPPLSDGIVISNNANTTVTDYGASVYQIEKTGGVDGDADADAVSSVGTTGDFVLRLKFISSPSSGNYQIHAGVDDAPTADSSYGSLAFDWVVSPAIDNWSTAENGIILADYFILSTDYVWIWRTGTSLGYGNGATLAAAQASPRRTTTSSAALYFDSSIRPTNAIFEALFYEVPVVVHEATGGLTGQLGSVAGAASSATTRASSGALTGQIGSVAGAASRTRVHATSGVLAGQGATVAGDSTRFRAHATSGAPVGQIGAVAGSAAHIAKHAATGALVGQIGSIAGSAARTRVHAAAGVLEGQLGSVAGAAAHIAIHDAVGALAGQGAEIAGAAARTRAHAASGVLAGLQAAIAGDADRSTDSATHDATGDLSAGGAEIVGASARTRLHAATGAPSGAGASVAAPAARTRAHAATGALAAIQAAVIGSADRLQVFDAVGVLSGQGSSAAGVSARTRIHIAAGDLPGLVAIIAGQAAIGIPDHAASGALTGAGATIQGAGGVLEFISATRTTSSGRRLTSSASGLNETRADNLLRTTYSTGRTI